MSESQKTQKTQKEWLQIQANAQALLNRHWHAGQKTTPEDRLECGACVLNGYGAEKMHHYINYAGWARVWIQAGKYIEPKYFYQFLAELASDNRRYAEALKQDILDFGMNIPDSKEGRNFKAAVQAVLGIYEY